jgi:hypothetical protein
LLFFLERGSVLINTHAHAVRLDPQCSTTHERDIAVFPGTWLCSD